MGSVVVCGGGVIGLATAIILARDGHQVTVLEANPAGVPATPAEAWESWQRNGVAQFRQPHDAVERSGEMAQAGALGPDRQQLLKLLAT